jgi:hypothetical protein
MADFQSITQAFVQQFDRSLQHEAQQKESRLMKAVSDKGMITGESFTHNRLASVEMDESNVRLAQTVLSPIDHSTRIATMKDFYKALALDEFDVPKMLINPVTGGDYMAVLIAAWNRKCDKIIYDALLGTVTLKSGSTVTLPAGQKILAGGTGFTKAKAIQARKLFRANEADNHAGEELNCIYTSEMLEDILSDTTLTSADFMAVKMLQEGDVAARWMGINWIPFEGVTTAAGESTTAMFTKRAIKFGKGLQKGNVSPRPDLRDAIQVSMKASAGAVRTDEDYVVQIAFTV